MYFSPLPCYLVPPGPKYSHQHLILNTVSLRSSLNVSDQVSHPYKTTGKVIVLFFKFLGSKLEDIRYMYVYMYIYISCKGTLEMAGL